MSTVLDWPCPKCGWANTIPSAAQSYRSRARYTCTGCREKFRWFDVDFTRREVIPSPPAPEVAPDPPAYTARRKPRVRAQPGGAVPRLIEKAGIEGNCVSCWERVVVNLDFKCIRCNQPVANHWFVSVPYVPEPLPARRIRVRK